jgi:hypothetical protein
MEFESGPDGLIFRFTYAHNKRNSAVIYGMQSGAGSVIQTGRIAMNQISKDALATMKNIIEEYLSGVYDRSAAVDRLIRLVNVDLLHNSDMEFMVTDCYYTIKHLTEAGYESTDFELSYFRDCINGVREYNLEEKMELTRRVLRNLSQTTTPSE